MGQFKTIALSIRLNERSNYLESEYSLLLLGWHTPQLGMDALYFGEYCTTSASFYIGDKNRFSEAVLLGNLLLVSEGNRSSKLS